jgi:hypothetical protein
LVTSDGMVQVSFPLTNLPTSTNYVTIGLKEAETHKKCIMGARRDDITGWERAQIATQYCLRQMLGIRPALGWVSERLSKLPRRATQVNAQWKPSIGESLAGDEIYSQGI